MRHALDLLICGAFLATMTLMPSSGHASRHDVPAPDAREMLVAAAPMLGQVIEVAASAKTKQAKSKQARQKAAEEKAAEKAAKELS